MRDQSRAMRSISHSIPPSTPRSQVKRNLSSASSFAEAGASVAVADRHGGGIGDVVRANEVIGSKAAAITCDASKAQDVNALEPISDNRKPDEIAAALFYMCLSTAAFMVGDAMVIDGGLTASLGVRAEVHGGAVTSRSTPVRSCDV